MQHFPAFKSDIREQKLTEERMQNIQYALIALSIIIFITSFLFLSRAIIYNERLILFFGVHGLFVVFKFVNLLIHLWFSFITHVSLVFMMPALV
ncbi:MAG: hypothetical protein ABI405_02215 [Parafilimonas sp.]